jgi:hypothetical protein
MQAARSFKQTAIRVSCKDFRTCTFFLPRGAVSGDLYSSLLSAAQTGLCPSPTLHKLVTYQDDKGRRKSMETMKRAICKVHRDYKRLKMHGNDSDVNVRFTKVNQNYKLCQTYPSQFAVPKSITDLQLLQAATFRCKQRIPAITYRHLPNGALLSRCAQPSVGLTFTRSNEDEAIFRALTSTSVNVAGYRLGRDFIWKGGIAWGVFCLCACMSKEHIRRKGVMLAAVGGVRQTLRMGEDG